MYSLIYKLNGQFCSEHSNNFAMLLRKYDELFGKEGIAGLRIHDNEYDSDFVNGSWEYDDRLIGWC